MKIAKNSDAVAMKLMIGASVVALTVGAATAGHATGTAPAAGSRWLVSQKPP